jgi:hypothetical protein
MKFAKLLIEPIETIETTTIMTGSMIIISNCCMGQLAGMYGDLIDAVCGFLSFPLAV